MSQALLSLSHTEKAAANYPGDTHLGQFRNYMAGGLCGRALTTAPRPFANLDDTTLGKGPTHPRVTAAWDLWDLFEPDSLMTKTGRTAEDCERAASLYRSILAGAMRPGSPEAISLKIRIAEALTAAMRIRTNGKVVTVDGKQDTSSQNRIWSHLGLEAKTLAEEAWKACPRDPKALSIYVDAAQYEGSSKETLRNARELQKWPTQEAGLGFALEGAFLLKKSPKKALDLFQQATDVKGTRRNLYYLGLAHFRCGDSILAKQAWQRSLAAPAGTRNDEDVADFIASQAKLGLSRAETKR